MKKETQCETQWTRQWDVEHVATGIDCKQRRHRQRVGWAGCYPDTSQYPFAIINSGCSSPAARPQDVCLHGRQVLLTGQKLDRASGLETFAS